MNLVMLSGNSLRNRDWIQDMQPSLASYFEKTYVQTYEHWLTGKEWIDLEHEHEVLRPVVKNFEPYGVFAKSIGTALTVQAIEAGYLQPRFLLLLGLPLDYIEKSYPSFFTVLADYDGPVVIIQNRNDPVGESPKVLAHFGDNIPGHIAVSEVPGDTHDYMDKAFIKAKLELLLASAEQI